MKQKLSLAISGVTALILVSVSGVASADKTETRLLKNNQQQLILPNNKNAKPGNGIFKKNNQNNNKVIVNSSQKNNNKKNNNSVIVNPSKKNNNTVIVNPSKKNNNTVIVNPSKKNNNTVIVTPSKKKPAAKPIVVQPVRGPWFRPILPGWKNWRGGKVVIVDNHHTHYSAFAFAMTAMAVAIVIDQSNDKPYTESGKPVTVKERSCSNGGETEVIELDDELLIITCK